MPLVYALLFSVWMLLFALGMRPGPWDGSYGLFPETACFLLAGFWVLCIAMGLVPSNRGYRRLFSQSSLAVALADADGNIVRRSSAFREVDAGRLCEIESTMIDENTRLHRKDVAGGSVCWQVDESEPNRINRELEDMREMLAGQAALLRMENELKEREAKAQARSQVYDRIAALVYPMSLRVKELSAAAADDPDAFEPAMRTACVCAVCIKRTANLVLLAEQTETLRRMELSLALSELARYLEKAGVVVLFDSDGQDGLLFPGPALIDALRQVGCLLDAALGGCARVGAGLEDGQDARVGGDTDAGSDVRADGDTDGGSGAQAACLQAVHLVLVGAVLKLTFEGCAGFACYRRDGLPVSTDLQARVRIEQDDDAVFATIDFGDADAAAEGR